VLHDDDIAISGGHTIVHVDADGRPAPVDERTRRLLLGP
jgi:hypothetical protein